ncbi:hypothetical protein BGZ73_003009 [Actinomortierella ambigua]|nr:hypothetical protein BGZ73_003009 [Actinomortierella ambigua]
MSAPGQPPPTDTVPPAITTTSVPSQPSPPPATSPPTRPTVTEDPDPPASSTSNPKPTKTDGGGGGGGSRPRPSNSKSSGPQPTDGTGKPIDDGPKDPVGSDDKKFPTVAVVGSLAAVLVLAFLAAVFLMRYRKRKAARKRLDALLDNGGSSQGQVQSALNNNKPRPESITSSRPSNAGPSGPSNAEMTAIGGAVGAGAAVTAAGSRPGINHNANDYYATGYAAQQHGYGQGQHPYGAYPDQYDQYGYPVSSQAGYGYATAAAVGYGDQHTHQPHPGQEYPPVSAAGGYYRGSPSMAHATAYPPPPPPTTGASPRASFHPPPKSVGTPTLSSTVVSGASPMLSDTPGTLYAEAVGSQTSPALNKVELSEAEKARLATYGRAPQAILPDDQNQIKVPVNE